MAFFVLGESEVRDRPLPRGVSIRLGTPEDEFATFDVMRRTMGYDMNWSHHASTRHHLRRSSPNSFWVAEEAPRFSASRVIGYARSVVRERVWSLTEFFLLPGHHRQGIGGGLLTRCLQDGLQAGADTRLVLASHHPSADALYIRKAGCFPRIPMLLLAGSLSNLRLPNEDTLLIEDTALPGVTTGSRGSGASVRRLRAEPMALTPQVQTILTELDRDVVGYARPQEHAHWIAEMSDPAAGGVCRFFFDCADRLVGYAYLGPHTSGPALAVEPDALPWMLTHVAALARARARGEVGLLRNIEQYWAVAGNQ